MGDIITIIGLLFGCVLGLRGMYLFYLNRTEAKRIFGVETSKKIIRTLLLFFGTMLLLFSSLTYLNIIFGLVEITKSGNFYAVVRKIIPNLSTAILEEFFFRLLLFGSLVEFLKNRMYVVVIASILFASFHMPETILSALSYFLGGIMYGYAYLKFKNILVPIGIHFSWNFIQGTIFGYPVTGTVTKGFFELSIADDLYLNGGIQGPEGSVAGIIIRALIIIMIYKFRYSSDNKRFLEI